jgi:transglutaminase-like putative cysteine protease
MKWLLLPVVLLLFITPSPAYVQGESVAAVAPGVNQPDYEKQSVTSGFSDILDTGSRISVNLNIYDSSGEKPARELTLQEYVTPDDEAVKAMADDIDGIEDTYDVAGRWIYISDEDLNRLADKWYTPHEFLVDSPYYPANPIQGKAAGDCEEKANTLVSLLRAEGIAPEDVRVVLGEVTFNNIKTGHAWVEIFYNSRWLALDPSWGPYWNAGSGKLVDRKAVPFDYYAGHNYPVIQVWVYYNDVYYLDARNNTGSFPGSWADPAG